MPTSQVLSAPPVLPVPPKDALHPSESSGTIETSLPSVSSFGAIRIESPDPQGMSRGIVMRSLDDPAEALLCWNKAIPEENLGLFGSRIENFQKFLSDNSLIVNQIKIEEKTDSSLLPKREFLLNIQPSSTSFELVTESSGQPTETSERIISLDIQQSMRSTENNTSYLEEVNEIKDLARFVRVSHPKDEDGVITKGGIRVFDDAELQSKEALEEGAGELAKGMEEKIAVVGLNKPTSHFDFKLGGGKGELSRDKDAVDQKLLVFEALGRVAAMTLVMGIHDVPAPDMRSGPAEMDAYRHGLAEAGVQNPDFWITGKGAEGAHPLRPEATGLGVSEVTQQVLAMQDSPFSLQDAKIAVQGVGNVGEHTIHHLLAAGASITAISDIDLSLKIESGITTENFSNAMQVVKKEISLEDFNKKYAARAETFESKEIWNLGANLWIPAAGKDAIKIKDLSTVSDSKPLVIVCGANNALSDKTIEALGKDFADQSIYVVPPETANPAGVVGSAFEMQAALDGVDWENENEGNERLNQDEMGLKNIMADAVKNVFGDNISSIIGDGGYRLQREFIEQPQKNSLDFAKLI